MKKNQQQNFRINETIRAQELRVIGGGGENLGVLSLEDALKAAYDEGLDLIEVAPMAKPPVARIVDYGKFKYEQKKKLKEVKAKANNMEVKSIQVKTGTSENDVQVKAKRASEWLAEGHRVKAELYLRGRAKYMDKEFLHDRLKRFLDMLTVPYKVVNDFRKSPKGIDVLIEKGKESEKEN